MITQQDKNGEWIGLMESAEWDPLRAHVTKMVPRVIEFASKGKRDCGSALAAYATARAELGAVADMLFVGKHLGDHPVPSHAKTIADHKSKWDDKANFLRSWASAARGCRLGLRAQSDNMDRPAVAS